MITLIYNMGEDFHMTVLHFLNEITAWWEKRAKLWRKARKEETRKEVLKKIPCHV